MAKGATAASAAGKPLGLAVGYWLLLFAACGVAASILADAHFDGAVIASYLCVGLAIAIMVSSRATEKSSAPRTIGRGIVFGATLLICSILAWHAADVLCGGREAEQTEWLARIALAEFFGTLALFLLYPCSSRLWFYVQLVVRATLAAAGIVALVLLAVLTGPQNVSAYPPPENSPYRLPWKPGITRLCSQGNRAIISHRDWEEYAFDFSMPVGTEICAARAGEVVHVVDHHDGNGLNLPCNEVAIAHGDGTHAVYVHIMRGGSLVKVGQRVQQGDVICLSGNVGYSTSPHLHFHVVHGSRTIPITFSDVPGDGLPRLLKRYRSGG